MKASRATTGRFQTRLSFSTDEIDGICSEALVKGGYLPKTPEAIRVDRFVEKYFQCNAGYEDLPPRAMGYTLFDKKGKVLEVRVSSKLEDGKQSSERRVRSTWAHEAGHCLLHPILFIEESGQPTFSQTEGKNTNIEGRKYFAGTTTSSQPAALTTGVGGNGRPTVVLVVCFCPKNW